MMLRFALPALLLTGSPALAQDIFDSLPLECEGSDPAWSMTITEDGTLLDFSRTSDLDIAWVTVAEGADRPVALTLLGRGYTAIVILESAESNISKVRILTQRGETPVLLVGTCAPA